MLERRLSSRTFIAAAAAGLAILAAPSLGAQVSLEASTSAGVLLGTSREIVLSGSYVVSRLDWAMEPLALAGSELRASTPAGLRVSLEVRSGAPGKTGRITDKDFLNGDGVVTHFSEHDSFTEGALMLDARIGRQFALGGRFTIEPFAGFSLMEETTAFRFGWERFQAADTPGRAAKHDRRVTEPALELVRKPGDA